jgi:predicted nucleotidyltransferase
MAAKNLSHVKIKIPRKELEEFCLRYQVQRLALFGSVLGNEFRADSDVELSKLFERPVDLVPMDGLKPVIRDSVLSNIEEVYAA